MAVRFPIHSLQAALWPVKLVNELRGVERIDDNWTEAEKANAKYILLAKAEHSAAIQISNQGPTFVEVSEAEHQAMLSHFKLALTYAEAVSDGVLDKAHPSLREHWRGEMEQGLRARIRAFEQGDNLSEITGHALHNALADWWNANKKKIKIPK